MKRILLAATLLLSFSAHGNDQQSRIRLPIVTQGASTFYVQGHFDGIGAAPFLIDTGSGYSAIDESTLTVLQSLGKTEFVKKLRGIMADGSKRILPVYRLSGISLAGECFIDNLEVAIFPNKTRFILGLNALRRLAPFSLNFDEEPSLTVSNCVIPPVNAVSGLRDADAPADGAGADADPGIRLSTL